MTTAHFLELMYLSAQIPRGFRVTGERNSQITYESP